VQTPENLKRLAGATALVAVAAGIGIVAAPAEAATGPTATLSLGTVTVTGTANRDVIAVRVDADRLRVDFGFDGTVDAQFGRSSVNRLRLLAGGGDDGVSVRGVGVGDLPITLRVSSATTSWVSSATSATSATATWR
jgi:hypothetical protein